mmetsp:Transcript_26377/g.77990  ORF Transcript_26377/g.77990 Transcript_26377/m.77990 type:complete len:327 (-) Transcript_26377:1874-2854(-)
MEAEGSAHPQVEGRAVGFGHEQVRGALDLVVGEPVRDAHGPSSRANPAPAARRRRCRSRPSASGAGSGSGSAVRDRNLLHQTLSRRPVECRGRAPPPVASPFPFRVAIDDPQRVLVALTPERRRHLEGLGDLRVQIEQLSLDEFHHVRCDPPRSDRVQVPRPCPRREGISKQAVVDEGRQELGGEEGIAPRLLKDRVREGADDAGEEAERARDEGVHGVHVHVGDAHGEDVYALRSNEVVQEHPVQEAIVPRLVVSIAPHEEQRSHLIVGCQRPEHFQRTLVGPLQVFEEEHRGPVRSARRAKERPDEVGQASTRVGASRSGMGAV